MLRSTAFMLIFEAKSHNFPSKGTKSHKSFPSKVTNFAKFIPFEGKMIIFAETQYCND